MRGVIALVAEEMFIGDLDPLRIEELDRSDLLVTSNSSRSARSSAFDKYSRHSPLAARSELRLMRRRPPSEIHGKAAEGLRKRFRAGEEFDPIKTFANSFPHSLRQATDLSEGAKWAWLALALNAGKHNNDYPTLPALSRKIGVGRQRGRRFIQELVDFGLVDARSCGRPASL